MTSEMIENSKNAFKFVQQVYDESAALLREIEGALLEQPESFLIGRTSGYSISSRSSTGLEQQNVNRWLTRRFAVFFVEEAQTKTHGGQTITSLSKPPRVLYFRILLDGYQGFKYAQKPLVEPALLFGVLENMASPNGRKTKFEQLMGEFEYVESKLLAHLPEVRLKESYVAVSGTLMHVPLFSLVDSEAVQRMVIEPILAEYRG
jgi:hypothetical protein